MRRSSSSATPPLADLPAQGLSTVGPAGSVDLPIGHWGPGSQAYCSLLKALNTPAV